MAYTSNAVASNYGQAGASAALNQPKEIGLLLRADGLRSGLQTLRLRLEGFHGRLEGNGDEKGCAATSPVGISGTFADAESELRVCLQIVDSLNDKF